MIRGDRIVERMEALGLSQAELARRVGVTQPSIYKLIHENKRGSSRIHTIARELQTTPSYLMGETDDAESELPDFDVSFDERRTLEIVRQLPADDQKALTCLIASMAEQAHDARGAAAMRDCLDRIEERGEQVPDAIEQMKAVRDRFWSRKDGGSATDRRSTERLHDKAHEYRQG